MSAYGWGWLGRGTAVLGAALGAVIVAATAVVPGPAVAAEVESRKIRNWSAGAYTDDDTGAFSRCTMSVSYKSGITLLFSIDKKYEWALALINSEWRLEVGATPSLRMIIDDYRPFNTKAKVLSRTMVGVPLADNVALFNAFRGGSLLVIETAADSFQFRLDGTSDGLAWLLACVKRYENYAPRNKANPFGSTSRDPFGSDTAGGSKAAATGNGRPKTTFDEPPAAPVEKTQPKPTVPLIEAKAADPVATPSTGGAVSGAAIDARVDATMLIANLFGTAGVSGYRIASASEAPPAFAGAEVVFTADGLTGAVRVVQGRDARTVGAELMASGAQSCKGQYASGTMPAADGRSDLVHVFTGCDVSGIPTAMRYTIMPRKAGGFYLIAVSATDQAGDGRLKQVDSSIREASVKVVGRF